MEGLGTGFKVGLGVFKAQGFVPSLFGIRVLVLGPHADGRWGLPTIAFQVA